MVATEVRCRSNCGRVFKNENAERMHFHRMHSKTILTGHRQVRTYQKRNNNEIVSRSSRPNLYETVFQILNTNNGPMSMNDIVDALRNMKYPTANYNSLRGQVFTQVKKSVNGPIIKLNRTTYGLDPRNNKLNKQQPVPQEQQQQQQQQDVTLPPEIELAILRRDNLRKTEMIMGLVRLLTVSVGD